MTFADPLRGLLPIDGLEGCRPAGRCLYRRVLVETRCDRGIVFAWAYDGASLTNQGVRMHAWPGEETRV